MRYDRMARRAGKARENPPPMHRVETFETPLEVAARANGDADQNAAIRMPEMRDYFRAATFVQPFQHHAITPLVSLYAAPDCVAASLLVLFTGRGYRPFLPLAVALQNIDASAFDVLVLRDPDWMQYRNGIPGFAPSFPDLVFRVSTEFGIRYQRVVALGTSMGAHPAIRFALAGGAGQAVALGARMAEDAYLTVQGNVPPPAFDPICACLPRIKRPLLFVAAQNQTRDVAEATRAAALTGGQTRFEPGQKHNFLGPKWRNGRLGPFLAQVTSADAAYVRAAT